MKAKYPICKEGNRYGMLLVLSLISKPKNPLALCQCDCGNKVMRQRGALVRGKAISCGCLTREKSKLQMLINAISNKTDSCIIWSDESRANYGYGILRYNGRNERAHRVAYVLSKGIDINSITGKQIRHKCDNPPCINPLHLEEGTHTDNMRDMIMRGRARHDVGERSSMAKLTERQVREIKKRIADGEDNKSIAKDYPVASRQIYSIRIGRSWGHVK